MFRNGNILMNSLARAVSVESAPSPNACPRRGGAAASRIPYFGGGAFASFILTLTLHAAPAAAQQGPLTLEQCVEMALRSNLSLEIAAEKLVERDAAISEAGVANKPKVSANASYTYVIPGITGALSGTNTVPIGVINTGVPGFLPLETVSAKYRVSGNVLNAGISANYVLYSGNRVQNAQKIASQSRTMTEWQQKSAIREVRRDVTKAYYNVLAVNKGIESLDSAIAMMDVIINDMRNLVEVGMLGEHEVLLMEVELSNLRLTRQQTATAAQSAYDYMAMLIGVPVSTPITLVNELQSPESFSVPELASLQTRAQDASTDLKAFEEQLRMIETSIAITDAANLPTVVAAAGYSGAHQGRVVEPKAAREDWWKWENQATISIVAQWDIWDGDAKRHKRSQAMSQKRQLELAMSNIRIGLDINVRNSAASLQDAYSSIEVSRKSIAQAKRSYEIAYDLFQEGMLASSELLRAHNSVLQSEISYYTALSTFYGRQADLDYLVNEEK